jgi:hypothetical protein
MQKLNISLKKTETFSVFSGFKSQIRHSCPYPDTIKEKIIRKRC